MYKVGQSAVSRTVLPSIQQKQRSSYGYQHCNHLMRSLNERRICITADKGKDEPLFQSDIPLPLFSKKKIRRDGCSLTPPSTPSSPLVEEQIEFLHNSWRAFRETATGETDPSIVTYHSRKQLPEDFQPFNIDRFLAEKLLKELDIDPKFAVF